MQADDKQQSKVEIRFPNRIAYLREVARMKLIELARIVDVSRSHLALVEAGEKVPSAVIVHDIAAALEVTVEELFQKDSSTLRREHIRDADAVRHR